MLLSHFHHLTSWLETANAMLPNHVMAGFAVSYTVALVIWLPILYAALRVTWVSADVGPARKAMTTFFILGLGVPLYPVLAALLLALVWLIAGAGRAP